MRCFIAVDLDEVLVNRVREIQEKIKRLDVDVKFVEAQNLHFTLKFLGEVSNEEIEIVKKDVERAVKGIDAFHVKIGGLGFFGTPGYVRTIWLGITEGVNNFVNLMKNVNECVKIGKRSDTAHLTIGRVKSGKNRELLMNFINTFRNVNIGEMYVKSVKLKESILTSRGPVYSDLALFRLGT